MESRLSEEVSRTAFGNQIVVSKPDPFNIYGSYDSNEKGT